MPLRLKSLELHGYKTFAARADFEFAEGITAIVGPNGSGKSNIADAIRWVLGEQSYSLLRAKKTEDMIFGGSEQRPRAGMASATVIFDNSDGWLPVDFSEVGVTRRAYRDGHNEYLLNGQQVRLKDIYELLAQSGLSERTYTILGQGLVDASLALKADERRRLFEEAAGVGLYRTRREEAIRRLDTTRRNLERAQDIMSELEPRLKSLERQARRAQEYSQIQADLRLMLRDWYGYHWHRSQNELSEAHNLLGGFDIKLQEARKSHQGVRSEMNAFRERLQELRSRLSAWHQEASVAHEQRGAIIRDLAVLDERERALRDNRQNALVDQGRLVEELRIAEERSAAADGERAEIQSEYEQAQLRVKEARAVLELQQEQRAKIEFDLSAVQKTLGQVTVQQAGMQARLDELVIRVGSQQQKLECVKKAILLAENDLQKAEREYQEKSAARMETEKAVEVAEIKLNAARNKMEALENQQKEQQAQYREKQTEGTRQKTQLDVLEQAEDTLAGYPDGARLLLDAAKQKKLAGVQAALTTILDVPAELEIAISAVLGEYTDAIIFQSGQAAEQALTLLDEDGTGRASLLPLDWLHPMEMLDKKTCAACIGIASDLVRSPAAMKSVVDLLLGQVLVVRDRKTAREVLKDMPAHVRAVTLRGEVFQATGQVLAGGMARAAMLGRPRQRRELLESIGTLGEEIRLLEAGLQETEKQILSARSQLEEIDNETNERRSAVTLALQEEQQAHTLVETASRQLDWQKTMRDDLVKEKTQAESEQVEVTKALKNYQGELSQIHETIRVKTAELASLTLDEYQSQAAYWGTRLAVAEKAVEDTLTRQTERQQVVAQTKEQIDQLGKRLADIGAGLESLETERGSLHQGENLLNLQEERLRGMIEPTQNELDTAEAQEAELQKEETDQQQYLTTAERQYAQAQLELSRKQESLELLRQKIEDDFGLVSFEYQSNVSGPVPLPFEGMVEQLNVLTELPADLEENMLHQRALLRRMGPVNPEAQQEFEAVKQRYEFMTGQLDDLHKAEADLHKVIAELDELTKTEFFTTFTAVAEEFHDIFHRLFGGGSARLVLTDPENLTETGIDIEARLPGRREQGLSLLSGGERSLTAIALVFSLLKVSPTPVCVMDEVDAMLDEANVGRFRDLLLDLSRATQFVIITHNRNTVQAADVIYGVTMGRDSTSQVISLRLDEVSEEYLK